MIVNNPMRIRTGKRLDLSNWLPWYGAISVLVLILIGVFG